MEIANNQSNDISPVPPGSMASPQRVYLQGAFALDVGEEAAQLKVFSRTSDWFCAFPPGWRGLVFVDRIAFQRAAGTIAIKKISCATLARLQAFMDAEDRTERNREEHRNFLSIPTLGTKPPADRKAIERWFLALRLNANQDAAALATMLRQTEAYSLVRFLLDNTSDLKNLSALAERYGVSYSHFRRLCNYALGGAAKTELNKWRMARSLLEVVNGCHSIADVALKYGYASGSHFSQDVRKQVGFSPRDLSDIDNFKVE
jgi:AraC-like DNA-binding protein